MADTRAPAARPLSPHLQIYRLSLTMVMSGAHRITGIFLYFRAAVMAWLLTAPAGAPNAYANVQWFMGTWFGRFVLLGYTWTLFHHTFGGIRHLIWDTGRGFGPSERDLLAAGTLFASITCKIVLLVA